jgi:hypothetical protein
MPDEPTTKALELLELTLPITQEQLDQRRKELLHIWDPHRFAHLTNNPRKYMQMVKKGETMTKEIERAYRVLQSVVEKSV